MKGKELNWYCRQKLSLWFLAGPVVMIQQFSLNINRLASRHSLMKENRCLVMIFT